LTIVAFDGESNTLLDSHGKINLHAMQLRTLTLFELLNQSVKLRHTHTLGDATIRCAILCLDFHTNVKQA